MVEDIVIFTCGPSTETCKCECGKSGGCEHKWDGEFKRTEYGGTATCSRCGADCFDHDMWTRP